MVEVTLLHAQVTPTASTSTSLHLIPQEQGVPQADVAQAMRLSLKSEVLRAAGEKGANAMCCAFKVHSCA